MTRHTIKLEPSRVWYSRHASEYLVEAKTSGSDDVVSQSSKERVTPYELLRSTLMILVLIIPWVYCVWQMLKIVLNSEVSKQKKALYALWLDD